MGRHATSTGTETNEYKLLTGRIKKQHFRIRDGKKTLLKWILMTHIIESTKKNNEHSDLITIIQIPGSTERLKKHFSMQCVEKLKFI